MAMTGGACKDVDDLLGIGPLAGSFASQEGQGRLGVRQPRQQKPGNTVFHGIRTLVGGECNVEKKKTLHLGQLSAREDLDDLLGAGALMRVVVQAALQQPLHRRRALLRHPDTLTECV